MTKEMPGEMSLQRIFTKEIISVDAKSINVKNGRWAEQWRPSHKKIWRCCRMTVSFLSPGEKRAPSSSDDIGGTLLRRKQKRC